MSQTLVIEREKWLRGVGSDSMLLRPDNGKMCCLGFFGLACGLTPDQIRNTASPSDTPESDRWPTWLLQYLDERGHYQDTDACNKLISENDAPTTPESLREAQIATIFAKHGVTVRFV